MYPNLFHLPAWVPFLGGEAITSFGLMVFLCFMAAGFAHRSGMKLHGLDPEITWDLLFMAVLGGILGAKLYYILLNFPRLLEDPAGLIIARGGLVFYGGLMGGAALVTWKILKLKLHLPTLADITAPTLPLGYAIGRMGCFLVGDDWGRPTASWVGIRFPEGAPPTSVYNIEQQFGIQVDPELIAQYGDIVPVHPTQLYEIVLSLMIFGFLWSLRKHTHAKGWLIMVWLVLAGLERFAVEFFRAKDDRFFGPLTLAQVISLLMVTVGIWGFLKLRNMRSSPGTSPSPA